MDRDPGPSPARRRWLLAAGAVIVLAILFVLIWLLVGKEAKEAKEADEDEALSVDASWRSDLILPDAESPADSEVKRPSATRRVTSLELRKLQRRHRAMIQACYDRAARHAPSLVARRASVTVQLADGGRIKGVRVEAGDNRQLEGCVRRVVRGFRFSATHRAQQVSFPIFFMSR